MNNKVQQRFDRSIRDAIDETARVQREKTARVMAEKEQKARRLLPLVEEELMSGCPQGERRDALLSLRSDYRRILGFTVDRHLAELPTPVKAEPA